MTQPSPDNYRASSPDVVRPAGLPQASTRALGRLTSYSGSVSGLSPVELGTSIGTQGALRRSRVIDGVRESQPQPIQGSDASGRPEDIAKIWHSAGA